MRQNKSPLAKVECAIYEPRWNEEDTGCCSGMYQGVSYKCAENVSAGNERDVKGKNR